MDRNGTPETVADLLILLKEDWAHAWTALLAEAVGPAHRACARIGLDDRAGDVAEEACVRAFKSDAAALRRARGPTDLRAWVAGVVRNVVRELARERKQSRDRPGHRAQDPARIAREAEKRRARLAKYPPDALEHLTGRQRDAIEVHLRGYPASLVARHLGMDTDAETAKDRVRRAWHALDAYAAGREGSHHQPLPPLTPAEVAALSRTDREVYERWSAGERVSSISRALALTRNAVHCRIQRLRRELRPS